MIGLKRLETELRMSETEIMQMMNEYLNQKRITKKPIYVIAVDFDGTLVTNAFPDIQKAIPRWDVYSHLKNHIDVLSGKYDVKLILWTCREDIPEGMFLSEAVAYCEEKLKIKFDGINENPFSEWGNKYPELVRKIVADEYWDDKNVMVNDGGYI